MGRTSEKKKRRHSSHKKKLQEDSDSDDETSSSDYDSDSSSFSSESSSETTSTDEEERRRSKKKKARRMSKEKKKASKLKKKKKGRTKKKRLGEKLSINTISMDDYYLRSAEFRTWLSKERKTFFSDLTSDESRALFKKFVKKWNSGILDKSYYHGIQSTAVGHSLQSNYQWKFSSEVKPNELQTMRDSVSSWSSSKTSLGSSSNVPHSAASDSIGPAPPVKGPSRPSPGVAIGPSMPPTKGPPRIIGPSMGPVGGAGGGDAFEKEEAREREQLRLKKERKDFRKHQEMVLDELAPKATGREARIEKKKIRAEKRKEREHSPDLDEVSIYGISGSGSSSISSKVKARQEERQNRAIAAAQRISSYQAKEKATVEAILEMAKAHKKEGALW